MNPRTDETPGGGPGDSGDRQGSGSSASVPPTGDNSGHATLRQCLDALDIDDDELLSFGRQIKGGTTKDFRGTQMTKAALANLDLDQLAQYNVWAGVNPMRQLSRGRGGNEAVARIAAIHADLDLGKTGQTLPDLVGVTNQLSEMLQTTPAYFVFSGHGLQLVYGMERDDDTDLAQMKELLSGWGRLVQHVAAARGGTADSVFDASRVLRVPGSINWKNPEQPVHAFAYLTGGAPISVKQLADTIETYLPPEPPKAEKATRPQTSSNPTSSCRYVGTMLAGLETDDPDERHPWATRAGIKLACLRRLGCITDDDFDQAVETLVGAMTKLCKRPRDPRDFDRSEVVGMKTSIIETALVKAAGYDEATLWEKVGDHDHTDPDDFSWMTQDLPPFEPASMPARSDQVPELHPAAFHGIAGDYVAEIAPFTESDPLAVLVQVLAWVGCRLGRSAYVRFGNAVHYPVVWPLIVGKTSTGRKGNSSDDSVNALSAHNALPRRRSGLSSGEGLIEAFMSTKADETPPDPRLLIVETEWEGVLAKTRREGNSLSAVLRDAWDGRTLATMNSGGLSREVNMHSLTVVGHITPQALREGMTGADLSNGFLNRFLIVAVHRPHLVPWPEPMSDAAKKMVSEIVTNTVNARSGEYTFTKAAKDRYVKWYKDYSTAADGQAERVAMATARNQANLLRLALIHAALDNTDKKIDAQHIEAAIALIANSAESCSLLLAPGKAGLDAKVVAALNSEEEGMTKTQLRDHFQRHVSAAALNEALAALLNAGEITQHPITDTGGRPATAYRAVARKARKAS